MKLLILLLGATFAHAHSPYTRLQIRDWGDALFREPDRPDELNDPVLSGVTRAFGSTRIPMRELPIESDLAQADRLPWSSWWFPKVDRDLFDDGKGTSPLEKYDLIRSSLVGRPSRAAATEKKGWDPNRPRWEGLCDAWAIAATVFDEPTEPSATWKVPGGPSVTFSVADQKALLLKTLDSVPIQSLEVFGQRFTGNADGWIFPDLFPQELHRYVEVQLFQRRRLFVMDHDPGVEVWSEPVYKANYRITAIPGRTDAVYVRLWLYSATSFPQREQKENTGIKEQVREYDYILQGRQDGAGNLEVTSGVWVKGDLVDSRRDHPDFVYSIPDPSVLKRVSANPEIDSTLVDKILRR